MNEATGNTTGTGLALRQLLAKGFDLLRRGQVDEAMQLSDRLLADHPADPEVLFLACETYTAAEIPDRALGFMDAAIAAVPGQFELLIRKAGLLMLLRRRVEAWQVADEAVSLAGDAPNALYELAEFYRRYGDPIRACDFYQKAMRAGSVQPSLRFNLANAQFYAGDFAGAEKNLEIFLAGRPKNGHALYLRAILRSQTEASNHIADLQGRLKVGFSDDAGRAACLYALAKEYEDLGQSEQSFSALTDAAGEKRRSMKFDGSDELATIAAIGTTYSAEAMQGLASGHEEEGAIFIVGMPRTGTTLVERVLGRHEEVTAAGELLDFGQLLAQATNERLLTAVGKSPVEASLGIDFARLGRDYMASARDAAPGSRMFIDKLPVNYLYCGLIGKALPRARIIHMVRDPMDSCYAIYKTLFGQAYYFSYDLNELADYYIAYHRLMQHWHEVMPGAILDVRYEDLVADPEGQTRRIFSWCGLEWDARMLALSENLEPANTASAAQVRRPVYTTSVQKWRRYEAGLAPLRARLVAAGVIDA